MTTLGPTGKVLDAISRGSLKGGEAATAQDPRRINHPTGGFWRIEGAQKYQTTDTITILWS